MQSRRRLKSSPLCAYRKGSLCRSYRSLLLLLFFLSSLHFFLAKAFGYLSAFHVAAIAEVSPLCPPSFSFPSDTLTAAFFLLPSLFPPLSFSSSSSRSSRHCHSCPAPYHLPQLKWAGSITTETCGDCFRRETGGEGRRRSRVLLRTSPPLLRLQAYFLVRIFLLFLLFPCFSFFFLFDELVIVQGGSRTACVAGRRGRRGAGAVLQPSGMRDLVWEWWAQPHPLLLVSFLHLCSQTLFHPLTQPPTLTTCHLLLHLSLHGARLLCGAAAGSNDVCKDTGLMGGVQESNFSPWNDAFVKDVNSNHSVGSRACESTRVW